MPDLFSLTSSALPADARVLAFRGAEAISTLYRFEIYVLIDDPAFDMGAALGADTTLVVNREDGQPYLFHGILASLETVGELGAGALYRAVLVPRLWRLTLDHHNRVFVDESAPAILQTVLRDAGMAPDDAKFELTASYPPLPHVCQYRESYFDFLSRRMEREGIYYFFEQGDGRERLVVTDDRSSHQPLSDDPVRYFRVGGAGAAGVDGLRSFTCKHSTIVGSVALRDHDYLRPALPLAGEAKVSDGPGSAQLYGENFLTPEEGARLARVRAEEKKARQVVFRGAGHTLSLRPGYTFKLEDHPRFDGEYLVTELTHAGNDFGSLRDAAEMLGLEGPEGEGYHVELVALPKSAPFRPERRTPVPRIYGTERAVVDGAAESDYAQLDEHGRYLVRIHFDESPGQDGKSSTRIRMMQPHGGSPESFHFPLRKGTEVMLTFEGGDPDRPVIAGVVPNLVNQTLVTSRNATKNIIMTGGGNRIVIEDQKGKEFIHFATPHKGTYLHLGSPFNPQYNKVTNTSGTSLSYTQDISTSVTGTDAQTIVEDARITIIGRGQMYTNTPPANEIVALLGPSFVGTQFENPGDVLYETILADSQKVLSDAKKLDKALGASAPKPANGASPADPNAVLAAIEALTSDLQTLAADALSLQSALANNTVSTPTNPMFQISAWQASIQTAIIDLATAKSDVTKGFAATSTSYTSSATAETAAQTAATTGPILFPDPKATQPWLPNPNAAPNYILLTHADTHTTTLSLSQPAASSSSPESVNAYVTEYANSQTPPLQVDPPDATAMDPLSMTSGKTPPSLSSGSDIKIVGGDNVTMVQQDARSHVMGMSYGLVQGGQASVVRNGQRSKVVSPRLIGVPLSGFESVRLTTPWKFTPLAFPDPLTPLSQDTAQTSEVYGDQLSWVDGTVSATVTKGKHAEVFSPVQCPATSNTSPRPVRPNPAPVHDEATTAQSAALHGDQFSWVDGTVTTTVNKGKHSEIFAPTPGSNTGPHVHVEPTTAQSTTLHGDQFSWVDGDKTSNVTGHVDSTVSNGQTTHIFGGQTSHVSGGQTTLVDYKTTITVLATSLAGVSLSMNLLKIAATVVSVSDSVLKVDNGVYKFDNKGLHLLV